MLNKYLSHDWKDCNSLMTLNPIVNHFYLSKLLFSSVQFSHSDQIRSDQSLSHVRLFATPWIAARQASLSITNSRSSLRLTSIKSVMPSSHLILCRPLFLLPPIPPSIRVFSNESTLLMRWPKYWSFSFSIIIRKLDISILDSLCLTQWQISHIAYFIEDHE